MLFGITFRLKSYQVRFWPTTLSEFNVAFSLSQKAWFVKIGAEGAWTIETVTANRSLLSGQLPTCLAA